MTDNINKALVDKESYEATLHSIGLWFAALTGKESRIYERKLLTATPLDAYAICSEILTVKNQEGFNKWKQEREVRESSGVFKYEVPLGKEPFSTSPTFAGMGNVQVYCGENVAAEISRHYGTSVRDLSKLANDELVQKLDWLNPLNTMKSPAGGGVVDTAAHVQPQEDVEVSGNDGGL